MTEKQWENLGFNVVHHASGSTSWTKALPNGISIDLFGAHATERECALPNLFGPYSINIQFTERGNGFVSDDWVSIEVRAQDGHVGVKDTLITRIVAALEAECSQPTLTVHPLIEQHRLKKT